MGVDGPDDTGMLSQVVGRSGVVGNVKSVRLAACPFFVFRLGGVRVLGA